MSMRLAPALGIFGGTFDPIHNGHIFPVVEAAEKVGINKVALMPCYIPSHKDAAQASSQDRLVMVEKVCIDYPLFFPDPRDIKRGKPTFSLESLSELRKELPNTPICFFIGTDSLQNLFDWQQWQTLFSLCHFVVCDREGDAVTEFPNNSDRALQLETLLKERQTFAPENLHTTLSGFIYIAKTQTLTVSSSEIRQLLLHNQSAEEFLPPKILDYIRLHKLYQPGTDF